MTRLVLLSLLALGACDAADYKAFSQGGRATVTCTDCPLACAPLPVAMCQPPRSGDGWAQCYCGAGPVVIERVR